MINQENRISFCERLQPQTVLSKASASLAIASASLAMFASSEAGGMTAERQTAGTTEEQPARQAKCRGLTATIVGTSGPDYLVGTKGRDVIAGKEGNDRIYGLSGNDVICAGEGSDLLNGGSGRDRLVGADGNDEIDGSTGRDSIMGGRNQDWCQRAEIIKSCETNRSLSPVPGKSRKAGTSSRKYTYQVLVENGIAINRKETAEQVDSILADKRGWTRTGRVAFQRVERNAGTQVILATPDKVDALCYPLQTMGRVSCRQGSRVILNLNRWRYAVPHWPNDSVNTYRQMVVNHEMGHRIGFGHSTCSRPGAKAPVMQQQTKFLLGCKANPWPLSSEVGSL